MKKSARRILAIGAATAAGLTVLPTVPVANAETTTTTFDVMCLATPSSSLAGGPQNIGNPGAQITVDAPATVNAGDEFDVLISPPPITIPNGITASGITATIEESSRIKIDVMMPDNATYLSGEVVPGTSIGLSGTAPNMLRVNEAGTVDPNGTILRLSGNNQVIGNGPSSSKNSSGGIVAKNVGGSSASTTFKLPQVKARLKAGTSGAINLKLRTAGDAGTFGNDKNPITLLPKASAPLVGTIWAPAQCTPRTGAGDPLNNGAGPLATVNITEADKQTTTTLAVPSTVKNGDTATLTANIAPAANGGTVQFSLNGDDLGAPVDVENGKASIEHKFETDGDFDVKAVFSGTNGFEGSTSSTKTIKVTTDDVTTSVRTTGPNDAYVDEDVNLTAQVTPAIQGGTVTFTVDGASGPTAEVGSDGTAVAPYKFTTPGTHRVLARYSGRAGVAGSVAPMFPVSVTAAPAAAVQTTTTLSPVGTVNKGESVTLKATVDPSNANGTVQFKIGDKPIGRPVRVVNGVATLTTTFATGGEFAISAQFTGDNGFIDSASDPETLKVPGGEDPGTPTDPGTGSLGNIFGS
ncbi:hypothetical protein nbrc107696_05950 [Gordonia spumicola]|uniref:Bacterial Ig-like domain-containing protein n=1 Tax=Gordonia spumicola TaxID=589161 RepID=A0A7I9V3Z3_9ACTN|nr:Ig-like domain-containing protein [Gordonia spumicola]GEE00149.1 hypothetical protein nbrc107696_05950 [Gordonia spumicola]